MQSENLSQESKSQHSNRPCKGTRRLTLLAHRDSVMLLEEISD